ncbi:unspecified product [Leptomonas pyrrhocoris]|uniref:Unspecified product n=1 Tax=Leptomonas pyrrhocoris TaxID=157538 RepID=A0A0M9FYE3_LEPPY|nr:unspecified product [Leptomonas pyrrhocoris]KPA78469.1 unspecified product [Leptomonas pyrrhocoris]|eukprot:XP_015656908.1 unspecified product [Leptomonas pyrrhocoris]
MKASTRARFDELWRLLSSPGQDDLGDPPSTSIFEGDARALMKAGVLVPASSRPTRGWVVPLSVAEEKPAGKRRRFIAWPKAKNGEGPYEADVPLGHVTGYLEAVWEECASNLDLKASFYQVPLPEEARAAYLRLEAFREHLPARLRVLIDNTSVLGAVRRGVSKLGALSVELQGVDRLLQEAGIHAVDRYIRSENNVADLPSRARDIPHSALSKGYHLRGGDRDPWNLRKDP